LNACHFQTQSQHEKSSISSKKTGMNKDEIEETKDIANSGFIHFNVQQSQDRETKKKAKEEKIDRRCTLSPE
jgi:hypothetical protein